MTQVRAPYYLLRDPSLSTTRLAFSYGGNIWVANRDGGELRRLTSGGSESKPAFSPDGSQIAFIVSLDAESREHREEHQQEHPRGQAHLAEMKRQPKFLFALLLAGV